MKYSNIYNFSMTVCPRSIKAYNSSGIFSLSNNNAYFRYKYNNNPRNTDCTTQGNSFYLFSGTKPSYDVLKLVDTKDKLLTDYGSNLVARLENQPIEWTYDLITKTRTVRKKPNAENIIAEIDGDITWAAIVCTPSTSGDNVATFEPIDTTKDSIIFTNTLGTWDDTDTVITMSKLNGIITGEEIIFKDFSFRLRDKADFEGVQ